MSYRLASLRLGVVLAVIALGTPWLYTVQAQSKRRGKSVEFSTSKSDEVTTNLYQFTKKESVKQWEAELRNSMRSFSTGSSLEAVAPPPENFPLPTVPSKRLKPQQDRRKNTFLMTTDDLGHVPTGEELLKVPEFGDDGREKQSKTDVESYYDRQDAKNAAASKSNRRQARDKKSDASEASNGRDKSKATEDGELPSALDQQDQALRKLFQTDGADNPLLPAAPRGGTLSDPFGTAVPPPTKEQELEHKKYMQEFSTIFDTSRGTAPGPGAINPANPGSDSSRRLPNPLGVPDTSPLGNGMPGLVNPVFTPTGPLDMSAQSPLLYKSEGPKWPTVPSFAPPRRPF